MRGIYDALPSLPIVKVWDGGEMELCSVSSELRILRQTGGESHEVRLGPGACHVLRAYLEELLR